MWSNAKIKKKIAAAGHQIRRFQRVPTIADTASAAVTTMAAATFSAETSPIPPIVATVSVPIPTIGNPNPEKAASSGSVKLPRMMRMSRFLPRTAFLTATPSRRFFKTSDSHRIVKKLPKSATVM